MTITTTVVVANPKPGSRTRQVAESIAAALLPAGSTEPMVIDLADHAGDLLRWPSDATDALVERITGSDLVVLATPTYKSTFTGLLKALLDRVPALGLAGVTVVPVMSGGDRMHAMAPNQTLVPILLELGAMVPGRGHFIVIGDATDLDAVAAGIAAEVAAALGRLERVAIGLRSPDR